MSQSLARNLAHLVFSTKSRQPVLSICVGLSLHCCAPSGRRKVMVTPWPQVLPWADILRRLIAEVCV